MRLPRISVSISSHLHDDHIIDFGVDYSEWADPDVGTMALRELLSFNDAFKHKVTGVPYNRAAMIAAAQDAFIPLVENGDLWWEDGLAYVNLDTIKSMTCLRELAKQP